MLQNMECKLRLEKDPDNDTCQVAGKSGVRSCEFCSHAGFKCFIGCLTALICISLTANVFLHFNYLHLKDIIKRQSEIIERLDRQGKDQDLKSFKPHSDSDKINSGTQQIQKREYNEGDSSNTGNGVDTARQQRRRRNRRRNNRRRSHRRRDVQTHNIDDLRNEIYRLKRLLLKPIVQLRAGSNSQNSRQHAITSHKAGCSDSCFIWAPPSEHYRNNFDYDYDYSTGPQLVTGIKIRTSGFYRVYAQIVINGRQNNLLLNPEFGYETIKIEPVASDPNGNQTVLLKSYVTQDYRGRGYPDSVTSYAPHGTRALDTIPQGGIFKLNCNDIIVVRPIPNISTGITFLPNPESSYFGIEMVNYDTDRILHDDNSCQ